MSTLPTSIEAYLNDAGFSGTEILILNKLLESDAMSLRELASKTGKSTGVLNQAMDKLLKKEIIGRIIINKSPKYTLQSLEVVTEWMAKDTKQKHSLLVRRQENFQAFITSLTTKQARPQMQYFEGLDGIKQAYTLLLEDTNEMLHYLPARYKEEEDPLAAFRKTYFNIRMKKNIYCRIISEDTTLGRRYQSRDHLSFRKTLLVSSDRYPFFIEQIISGGNIAYIDHDKLKACILCFSNLAQYDSLFFEADWSAALLNIQEELALREKYITSISLPE
jgi:DNA-binding MarR family transcriptional regulator